MGKIQKLDWGYIDWIFEPAQDSQDHMRIGISTMFPHTVQARHVHCGDEQLIYVLSGQGRHWIEDKESEMQAGSMFHISSGQAHESINDGDEPLVKLLISIPSLLTTPKIRMNKAEHIKKQESINKTEFLRDTVKELFRSMLSPLRIPLSIFDAEQNLIYRNPEYPTYCCKKCKIDEDIYNCALIRINNDWMPPYYEGASAYVCEHGLWVYTLPVVYEGELLGFIKAGHVRTGQSEEKGKPYNVPDSTVRGIVEVIRTLADSICNHYQLCKIQTQLQHNVRVLSDKEQEEYILQESLKTTQDKAFNLKIGQHFLFNTLNTIAGMAVKEEALETYQAIGDLSQLFRYTLRTDSYFVMLMEEIEYVRNYTNLQKLRFGKRLTVRIEVEPEILRVKVPFNFLQPVVENAFRHGLKNKTGKISVDIKASRVKNTIHFIVEDNGNGMNKEEKQKFCYQLEHGDGSHGTSMVTQRLKSLYGEKYQYEFETSSNGTKIEITIPMEQKEELDETSTFSG